MSCPHSLRSVGVLAFEFLTGKTATAKQQLLAIADSECAICLEGYSADNPGIRTACCGYHFHHTCLQQCIEQQGHCPICSAPKGSCKVVQQRTRQSK